MHRFFVTPAAMRLGIALFLTVLPGQSLSEPVSNPIAVFSGLDKITAVIRTFEVPVDKTVLFGTLEVTPRICNTRPPIETPKTTAFVDVRERRHGSEPKRIFSGWMFADSPGLSGVEHPVYDVWLTDCKT